MISSLLCVCHKHLVLTPAALRVDPSITVLTVQITEGQSTCFEPSLSGSKTLAVPALRVDICGSHDFPLCWGLCCAWVGDKRQWQVAEGPPCPFPTAASPLLASFFIGRVQRAVPLSQACGENDRSAGIQEATPWQCHLPTCLRQVWLWGSREGHLRKGPNSLPQFLQEGKICLPMDSILATA